MAQAIPAAGAGNKRQPGPFSFATLCAVIPLVALVVPYSTGAIMYYFNAGIWSIAPRDYMAGCAMLLAFNLLRSRPPVALPLILLGGILAVRLLDSAFLGRMRDFLDFNPVSLAGASVVYAIAVLAISGDRVTLVRCARAAAFCNIVGASALNIWEWNSPGYFSSVEGRSAGFLGNANDAAAAVLLNLALLLALRPNRWLAAFAIMLSAIGVYCTLSRSGALCWLLTVVVYLVLTLARSLRGFLYLGMAAVVVGALLLQAVEIKTRNTADTDISSRQELLMSGRVSSSMSDSSRLDFAYEAFLGALDKPFSGYGTFASNGRPFAPHNEFLAVWVDNGIFAALIFLLAAGLIVVGAFRTDRSLLIASVPLVCLIPFSHNLLENYSYLFVWVTTCGLIAHASRQQPLPAFAPARSASAAKGEADSSFGGALGEVSAA